MSYQRIRDLRNDANKTQTEIAKELKLQHATYCRYELGKREIPAWAVVKLAKYYKTSADYILGLSNKR